MSIVIEPGISNFIRSCCVGRSSYDVRNIWRTRVHAPEPMSHTTVPLCQPSPHSATTTEQFCVHGRTSATVAGTMCTECGIVLNQVHTMVDLAHSRPPVCDTSPVGDALLVEVGIDGTCTVDAATCLQEWRRHIGIIQDQPNEVIHNAYRIFRLVYEQQGPISGCKARAIMLVSLLYSSRLLHGNNKANEEYLLRTFCIPTRVMNRAFGSLAAVTLLQKGQAAVMATSIVTVGRPTQC